MGGRGVFFSFHHSRDNGRIGQVRNVWVTKGKTNSLLDKADWEKIKQQGEDAIKSWINEQLKGTSITIVLIGKETSTRKWVKYEIKKSVLGGNGLLGIYIHNLEDFRTQETDSQGENPFKQFCIAEGKDDGKKYILTISEYQSSSKYRDGNYLSSFVDTYNWKLDDGYNNIEKWIEKSIKDKKW